MLESFVVAFVEVAVVANIEKKSRRYLYLKVMEDYGLQLVAAVRIAA